MVLLLLGAALVLTGGVAAGLLWMRRRSRAQSDVIYLGYDDQDQVSSMKSAMLERVRRGDVDGLP